MKITSRRMFLTGTGVALALPLLPSLLPRSARAGGSSSPVRYVQVLNPYGPSASLFFGDHDTDQQVAANVNIKALADIAGDISPLVGSAFDPFRARISLLRGLDVMVENPNHHYIFPTCASGYAAGVDNDEAPPLSGQASIDTLMARSSKVYGDEVPEVQRVVNLNPVQTDDYSGNRSFSWRASGDGLEMIRPVKQTQGVLDPFAAGFAQGDTGPDPREQKLVDAVLTDYQRVRDGARISTADKARLDAYMDLVSDIGGGITTICEAPALMDESTIEQVIDNQLKILVAALACGMTRIGSVMFGMSEGYGSRHEQHHAIFGATDTPIVADLKLFGTRIANLLGMLDAITEEDGTLLDNTVLYWSMQYGCALVDSQHEPRDMPVLLAGGGGGRLAHGNFVDYRAEGGGKGIPLNNLLVTLMNCMSLTSADYEASAGAGYGWYAPDLSDRPDGAFWNSTEGRRSALPVIWSGTSLG
ncbi:MAG TPA: DUF1552 domain-containing protein [Nannocystaceae bacterium]|nr:DUF1552 domain-containing protein [Nannocystaceae bacterium]